MQSDSSWRLSLQLCLVSSFGTKEQNCESISFFKRQNQVLLQTKFFITTLMFLLIWYWIGEISCQQRRTTRLTQSAWSYLCRCSLSWSQQCFFSSNCCIDWKNGFLPWKSCRDVLRVALCICSGKQKRTPNFTLLGENYIYIYIHIVPL